MTPVATRTLALVLSMTALSADAAIGQPSPPASGSRMVELDGRKVHVVLAGSEHLGRGRPVVVFENGAGSTVESWERVLPGVARFAPVVAYDRAGLGSSEPDGGRPTLRGVAGRLHGLLGALKLEPPFVMVGHSLGGAYVRSFAALYPSEVAGMVYVDPFDFTLTPREFLEPFQAIGAGEEGRDAFLRWIDEAYKRQSAVLAAEGELLLEGYAAGYRELLGPPDAGVPMAVLAAGNFFLTDAQLRQFNPESRVRLPFRFRELNRAYVEQRRAKFSRWAGEAGEGLFLFSSTSGHYLQFDEPELTVSAIRRVYFPDIGRQIRAAVGRGPRAASETYRGLRARYPADRFDESTLDEIGQGLLSEAKVAEAVAVFEINAVEYPSAWVPLDSLAKAYIESGEFGKAASSFRKSLEIHPGGREAAEGLAKLKAK